jgi:hypothetical protein
MSYSLSFILLLELRIYIFFGNVNIFKIFNESPREKKKILKPPHWTGDYIHLPRLIINKKY